MEQGVLKKGVRVSLTLEAARRFPDVGTRLGTVIMVNGDWVTVEFDGMPDRAHSAVPTKHILVVAG